MLNKDNNLHLPKFDALPDIDLYADQVISYLNNHLIAFNIYDNDALITHTMINNYVKQGVIQAPIKKKYTKEHLAYLLIINILKRDLSIIEIDDMLTFLNQTMTTEAIYNRFVDEITNAVKAIYNNGNYPISDEEDITIILLKSAIKTVVNKQFFALQLLELTASFPHKHKKKHK